MARPASPLLDVSLIIDEALAMVDGGSALGMRGLAKRLDVAPSSLYHHVDNLPHLINLIRDRFAEAQPPSDGSWRDQVDSVIRNQRRIYAEHPQLVPLLMVTPITSPRALRHYDRLAQLFLDAGLSPRMAASAVEALDSFAIGSGLALAADDRSWGTDPQQPSLQKISDAWSRPSEKLDAAFDLGLTILLDGIQDRLTHQGDPV